MRIRPGEDPDYEHQERLEEIEEQMLSEEEDVHDDGLANSHHDTWGEANGER